MKSETTDRAVKDLDVGDIIQSDAAIYNAWRRHQNLRDIARDRGLTIKEVNRRLKQLLKTKLKHGVENYGEENNS